LRKVLPADVLVTTPPGYRLQIDADALDLRRFERLVARARPLDAGPRAELLREALGLWRGAPLADLAFETFAQREIQRLEELRLRALEERGDADRDQGGGAALLAEIEALLRDH